MPVAGPCASVSSPTPMTKIWSGQQDLPGMLEQATGEWPMG
jgi:hypothetical protein